MSLENALVYNFASGDNTYPHSGTFTIGVAGKVTIDDSDGSDDAILAILPILAGQMFRIRMSRPRPLRASMSVIRSTCDINTPSPDQMDQVGRSISSPPTVRRTMAHFLFLISSSTPASPIRSAPLIRMVRSAIRRLCLVLPVAPAF